MHRGLSHRAGAGFFRAAIAITLLCAASLRADVRVEEFWESPSNVTHDDNDTDVAANSDATSHPTKRLDGTTNRSTIDVNGVAETVIRGQSGLAWGGFDAATGGGSLDISIVNLDNAAGAGTLRNSFLLFHQHNTSRAANLPSPYNEQTGSYVYTLFSSNLAGAQSLDATTGTFKMALNWDATGGTVAGTLNFRLLIQTDNSKWYRSSDLAAPNVNVLTDPFGGANSDSLSRAAREALMSSFTITSMTWQRVSAAAEADMNQLDDGGEVPLGATQSDPGPNLANVTGLGVLIDTLTSGNDISSNPNSVNVLGMLLSAEAAITPTPTATPTPTPTPIPPPTLVNWENHPIHGLDISPNGQMLAVCNLPDDRLELFNISTGTPVHTASVPVGLDPMSVRFNTDTEAWVVNHISDSISVVDLTALRVVQTIQTLDEPCDLIFAGSPVKVFVSCSQVNTIQIFNPTTRLATGTVSIDGEEPRAMAKSADGSHIYVAIFESGNESTLLMGGLANGSVQIPNVVDNPAGPYGGQNPPPNSGASFNPPINPLLPTPPRVSLIVKKNNLGQWRDDNTGDWTAFVSGANANASGRPIGWDLIDHDVAIIDTSSLVVTYGEGLMNICMAIGVNPASGQVTIVGTDAINEIRFEPIVSGKFVRVKMASVDPSTLTKTVVDLNADHLNYSTATIPQSERDKSIGDPRGIVWNAAGTRGYVTGMGSNNLLIIDASGAPVGAQRVNIGEGPTSLVLDEARNRLYILNRFAGSISVVDTTSEGEIAVVPMFDPTPQAIKIGRKHFYNTHKTSGLGQLACASCHVDGRMDRLAWDLGNPAGDMKDLSNLNLGAGEPGLTTNFTNFHPMKGPMTTQTFQDIIGHEPFHWRGDRLGLEEFNPAFMGLNGDDTMLMPTEMQEFEDFVATIAVPPNPNRNFNNTLPTSLAMPGVFSVGRFSGSGGLAAGAQIPPGNAQNGMMIYVGVPPVNPTQRRLDGGLTCVQCHSLPTGNGPDVTFASGSYHDIPLGPLGQHHIMLTSADGSTQRAIKVPQLRNQFRKEGLDFTHAISRAGFGLLHDGSVDGLVRFLSANVFSPANDQELSDLVAFVMSFGGSDLPEGIPTVLPFPPGPPGNDTHAGVGKQVTITDATPVALFGQADAIATMVAMADLEPGRVDLIARGVQGGVNRGWAYDRANHLFLSDRDGETISVAALRNLAAPGSELTYTLVPRGTGRRIGIDRDGDGFGDRTEIEAGTDPEDAGSTPGPNVVVAGGPVAFGIRATISGPTASVSILVSNNGTAVLSFTGPGFQIVGANASEFAITNSPSTLALAPTAMVTVDVAFDPDTLGAASASLRITTNDPDEPTVDVPLSGIGVLFSATKDWTLYR